ncbi:MAG: hypothetical protein NTX52_00145 [Planctomycetota bacterium]|nr:hypothetical protein [Planctomycetota bacterium]
MRFNPLAAWTHATSVTRIPANAEWLGLERQPVFFQFAEHRQFSYASNKIANYISFSIDFYRPILAVTFGNPLKRDSLQRMKLRLKKR